VRALRPPPPPPSYGSAAPQGLVRGLARDAFGREIVEPDPPSQQPAEDPLAPTNGSGPRKETATDALGRRAGVLLDEIDFPTFVASLVNGTFDAMVDSSIRQMESFAELVAAVAKPLDQFAQENVTLNQARDWIIEQYPRDVTLVEQDGQPRLAPRPQPDPDGFGAPSPQWLADYGAEGADLDQDLLEEQILPQARDRVAQQRLQTLATMVLMGVNRIVVKDGTVSAKLRFRAAAVDHAGVDYAISDDPSTPSTDWTMRGSRSAPSAVTKVSTLGLNVQADSQLEAILTGEVRINFASETVPLDRFVDDASRSLLERHSRKIQTATRAAAAAAPVLAPAPTVLPAPPASIMPAAPAPSAATAPRPVA